MGDQKVDHGISLERDSVTCWALGLLRQQFEKHPDNKLLSYTLSKGIHNGSPSCFVGLDDIRETKNR